MELDKIDEVIEKVREIKPPSQFNIYVNKNNYDLIRELEQTKEVDYDSPVIIALQENSTLVIDNNLEDKDIEVI